MPGVLSYDEDGSSPQSLFDYAFPGGRYFWGVNAHAPDGSILTASPGYGRTQNSDFSFPQKGLVKGDKLLLKRKYGEAIEAYEKQLEKDARDIHALLMLARLYGVSIDPSIYEYEFTDYDKSLHYYERLYDLTGRVHYLEQIASIYYSNLGDEQKARETLSRGSGLEMGHKPIYIQAPSANMTHFKP